MSTKHDSVADLTEECERCNSATPHEVDVRILTESSKPEHAAFSREPYRISECRVCGHTETTRMNNA
jgi:uncharacterized metal-binding protein YceD (DUF177 family)